MTPSTGGEAEKKATVQESVTNLASGARQKVGGAKADTQAAATKVLHPFSKGEKEGANAKARATKAATEDREGAVRATGAQEAAGQRVAAKGGNMGHSKDYHQHFSDNGPATYTGNPGTESTPVQAPENGRLPPVDGSGDSAYSNVKDTDPPPSTTHKGIAPTGANGCKIGVYQTPEGLKVSPVEARLSYSYVVEFPDGPFSEDFPASYLCTLKHGQFECTL